MIAAQSSIGQKLLRTALKLVIIAVTVSACGRSSRSGSETAEVAKTRSAKPTPAAA